MAAEQEAGDAFCIPDFSKANFVATLGDETDPSPLFPQLIVHDKDELLDLNLDFKGLQGGLETLESFHFDDLSHLSLPEESLGSSIVSDDNIKDAEDVEDVWRFTGGDQEVRPEANYSWEAFLDPSFSEAFPAFLSEAGSRTWDAVLEVKVADSGVRAPVVLERDFSVQCLLALGLGRGSALFQYNEEEKTFVEVPHAFRVSGFSEETLKSSCSRFIECGNAIRFLETFIENTYTDSNALPTLIAVAEGVFDGMLALQTYISQQHHKVQSILQLQSLFKSPHLILVCLRDLVVKLRQAKDEAELLSSFFETLSRLEDHDTSLSKIIYELMRRVSKPWLESLEALLGLRWGIDQSSGARSGLGFRSKALGVTSEGPESEDSEAQQLAISSMMPTFMSKDDTRMIHESGKGLQFLETHHPEHPLVNGKTSVLFEAPKLEWQSDWGAVERVEHKAKTYAKNVAAAVEEYTQYGRFEAYNSSGLDEKFCDECDVYGVEDVEIQSRFTLSNAALNLPLRDYVSPNSDGLRQVIFQELEHDEDSSTRGPSDFEPPISLGPVMSFHPIISTQARLLNTACLRLFFGKHHLRLHINVQRRFQLFADGNFTSRLSQALFDPEMETAERTLGVSRSGGPMGLKIGVRESWPPASSELRLALMGILNETYFAGSPSARTLSRDGQNESMPGGLGFAIRDMSADELEQCMDPDSLTALDFLTLEYKPPAPLGAIITPSCLQKYDRLFKLLLRTLRLLTIVNQMYRNSRDRVLTHQDRDPVAHRFRIESHHFISTLYWYFVEAGVGIPWAQFEAKLNAIENRVNGDADNLVGHTESLDRLREYHERILDRILFATFLRKRQVQVMGLLEDIFTIILSFAKLMRTSSSGRSRNKEIRSRYTRFQKRVNVFASVCRGLSESRGPGDRAKVDPRSSAKELGGEDLKEDDENPICILSLRLEMSGFYSRSH